MRWYYEKDKQRIGPITDADIERLAGEGTITPDTRVWNEAAAEWMPYRNVQAGPGGNASPSPRAADAVARVACSQCGKMLPADDLIQYQGLNICASCKSSFFQKVKEGASLPGTMAYAGFWIRFGAKVIDGIITYIINLIIAFIGGAMIGGVMANASPRNPGAQIGFAAVLFLLQMTANAVYATFFVGKYQATPGKMAVGIMIITPDGGRVSYARALGRHFAEMLSAILLGIGYLMIAFDDEKRALHDRICDTRVIKKAR
jgi:uncharacterized RDD family membrane protein YckC